MIITELPSPAADVPLGWWDRADLTDAQVASMLASLDAQCVALEAALRTRLAAAGFEPRRVCRPGEFRVKAVQFRDAALARLAGRLVMVRPGPDYASAEWVCPDTGVSGVAVALEVQPWGGQ